MNSAKLQLSIAEMTLVSDPGIILTKNAIMGKVVGMMGVLAEEYGELSVVSGEWGSPKISKGENYRGLPYVILDYPRIFGREDVLAIRTMFWWGHYFSITLHLKGQYRNALLTAIRERIPLLAARGFHIGISGDEWRHELTEDNYVLLEGLNNTAIEKILDDQRAFLKLSATCGLDRWDEAPEVLPDLFRVLVAVIKAKC
jgi:hypothetical protein